MQPSYMGSESDLASCAHDEAIGEAVEEMGCGNIYTVAAAARPQPAEATRTLCGMVSLRMKSEWTEETSYVDLQFQHLLIGPE